MTDNVGYIVYHCYDENQKVISSPQIQQQERELTQKIFEIINDTNNSTTLNVCKTFFENNKVKNTNPSLADLAAMLPGGESIFSEIITKAPLSIKKEDSYIDPYSLVNALITMCSDIKSMELSAIKKLESQRHINAIENILHKIDEAVKDDVSKDGHRNLALEVVEIIDSKITKPNKQITI